MVNLCNGNDMIDKDATEIVDADGNHPSAIITDCSTQASRDDHKDGQEPLSNVSPLPTLESAIAENKQLYPQREEDRTAQSAVSPLPGTRNSEHIENAEKSSKRRSPNNVCNTGQLHSSGRQTSITIRNGVIKFNGCCLVVGT